MRDLANERHSVITRLRAFNLEPANAEDWVPTGAKPWSRIEQEVESSDAFVLVLGERYGWVPDEGPTAGTDLSVTHLEYHRAHQLGLPVLPFLKRLDYDKDAVSEDARKRDAFRDEVRSWDGGRFVSEFELAVDLADSVGVAIIGR
jgi:hypothetical protein